MVEIVVDRAARELVHNLFTCNGVLILEGYQAECPADPSASEELKHRFIEVNIRRSQHIVQSSKNPNVRAVFRVYLDLLEKKRKQIRHSSANVTTTQHSARAPANTITPPTALPTIPEEVDVPPSTPALIC